MDCVIPRIYYKWGSEHVPLEINVNALILSLEYTYSWNYSYSEYFIVEIRNI